MIEGAEVRCPGRLFHRSAADREGMPDNCSEVEVWHNPCSWSEFDNGSLDRDVTLAIRPAGEVGRQVRRCNAVHSTVGVMSTATLNRMRSGTRRHFPQGLNDTSSAESNFRLISPSTLAVS